MIPIRDNLPTRTTAWVVYVLVTLNVIAFLVTLPGGTAAQDFGAYSFQLTGADPVRPTWWPNHESFPPAPNRFEWWRIVTHMFMHGGWLHLLGNMWFLWLFGDNVEDRLGRGRMLLLYFAAGMVALASQVVADPSSPIPMIGASGAVAGALGAYLVLFPRASVQVLMPLGFVILPMLWQARLFLGLWLGTQVVSAFVAGNGPGVAWWAHIGGFLVGMGLARPLSPPQRRVRVEFQRMTRPTRSVSRLRDW